MGILAGRGDEHPLRSRLEMPRGVMEIGELPGRLDGDLDIERPPRKTARLGLPAHADLLTVDDQIV